jgi:hypothetical protein
MPYKGTDLLEDAIVNRVRNAREQLRIGEPRMSLCRLSFVLAWVATVLCKVGNRSSHFGSFCTAQYGYKERIEDRHIYLTVGPLSSF